MRRVRVFVYYDVIGTMQDVQEGDDEKTNFPENRMGIEGDASMILFEATNRLATIASSMSTSLRKEWLMEHPCLATHMLLARISTSTFL